MARSPAAPRTGHWQSSGRIPTRIARGWLDTTGSCACGSAGHIEHRYVVSMAILEMRDPQVPHQEY